MDSTLDCNGSVL